MLLLQEKKTAIGVHAMYVHSIFFQGGKRREKNIYAVIQRFFSSQLNDRLKSLRSIVTISKNKIILAYQIDLNYYFLRFPPLYLIINRMVASHWLPSRY